jgi:hypothetical protein
LDSYVNTLNAEPDWKQVLVELMDVLEKYGEKLPLAVLSQKRAIEKLLDGKNNTPLSRKAHTESAKRYHKSDADDAIAGLSSPVVSLMDLDSAARMLPASVTLAGAGSLDLHEGVA